MWKYLALHLRQGGRKMKIEQCRLELNWKERSWETKIDYIFEEIEKNTIFSGFLIFWTQWIEWFEWISKFSTSHFNSSTHLGSSGWSSMIRLDIVSFPLPNHFTHTFVPFPHCEKKTSCLEYFKLCPLTFWAMELFQKA